MPLSGRGGMGNGKLFTSEIHGAEEADIPLDWTWTTSKESGQKTKFASSFSMDEPRHLCGSLSLSLSPSLSLSLLFSFPLSPPSHLISLSRSLTHSPACLSLSISIALSISISLSLCLHRSVSHLLCVTVLGLGPGLCFARRQQRGPGQIRGFKGPGQDQRCRCHGSGRSFL